MKKLLYVIAIVFCGALSALAQTNNRPLIFVHGLNGNQYSWSQASLGVENGSGDFKARQVRSHTAGITYGENAGIAYAATTLQSTIRSVLPSDNNGFSYNQNIIIAHSQGGIVSRKLDRLLESPLYNANERRFGGIITFGSPHGGAQLLDNAASGGHLAFINDACESIIAGSFAEIGNATLLGRIFGSPATVKEISNIVCNLTTTAIAQFFASDFLKPITNDYKVSSSEIQMLNTYTHPKIFKIAAYGVEDSPEFWRTAYFLTSGNPNGINAPFTADADNMLVDDANSNRQKALDNYNYWNNKYNTCRYPCYLNWLFYSGNRLSTISNGWYKTYKWWEQSNDKWKTFIGANKTIATFTGSCTVRNRYDGSDYYTVNASNANSCYSYSSTNYDAQPDYSYQAVNLPNDGIVLAESAMAFPGTTPGISRILMPGSNHQQMRNDRNTKAVLLKAFTGTSTGSSYFNVPLR
jgi:pimeloyl-ACP methyl ester carboxylesterase